MSKKRLLQLQVQKKKYFSNLLFYVGKYQTVIFCKLRYLIIQKCYLHSQMFTNVLKTTVTFALPITFCCTLQEASAWVHNGVRVSSLCTRHQTETYRWHCVLHARYTKLHLRDASTHDSTMLMSAFWRINLCNISNIFLTAVMKERNMPSTVPQNCLILCFMWQVYYSVVYSIMCAAIYISSFKTINSTPWAQSMFYVYLLTNSNYLLTQY